MVNQTEGSCAMQSTNNAQLLLTVNKNTIIGTSLLKSVTYNALNQSTSGTLLSSLLYTQNVIEVSSLTNNTMIFDFDGLPVHQKLFVRMKAFTECWTGNMTLQMTLSGESPVNVSSVLTSKSESIL